ncbi:DUF2849 domain-containing protein [Nitratireductor sp. L1-7-SE]|uniref:DUF2849 domain-containing protein n=1 Tax=Nitratireductor rhodophyticola TaxID=2854036 RepID=A0ABS7R8G5_9HYPH|nr:DUF2849 domain-containing protein [Nitratireductor rhodophyticola]MBY8917239.1 DUF2849 domain-containing protein [Nitratireductor rhodophyticola]MBY8920332.1 DUF2849 domain-containing protein [Nitratireductor rhodophyticola]MEC9245207.1 DUF2849 domain-containing protein [Pseudomonadota bacterium]
MKIVAANRLTDGETVWLGAGDRWVDTIDAAHVARDPEDEARIAAAGNLALAANIVIDVSLVDVEIVEGRILPRRLRERIRAGGPSIHPEIGKQARNAALSAA